MIRPGLYHSTGSVVRPPVSAPERSGSCAAGTVSRIAGKRGWQLGEDSLQLDAGERGADAVVGTVPEREVAWPVAGDVEAARAGEDRGIVVGGAVVQQYQITGAHGDLPDLQAGPGVAGDAAAAAARSAQYLLHCGRDLVRIVSQCPPLG
jgi:hypothetical protein